MSALARASGAFRATNNARILEASVRHIHGVDSAARTPPDVYRQAKGSERLFATMYFEFTVGSRDARIPASPPTLLLS